MPKKFFYGLVQNNEGEQYYLYVNAYNKDSVKSLIKDVMYKFETLLNISEEVTK